VHEFRLLGAMRGLNLPPGQTEKVQWPAPPMSQVPGHGFELPERGPACCPWRLERAIEAMIDVVVNQGLLGVLDRALDCLELLRDLHAWSALLDHLDDHAKMAVEAMLWTSDVVKDPWFPLVKDPSEVCPSVLLPT
jgi:hypothetical protein